MCGIARIFNYGSAPTDERAIAGRMRDAMLHRGPDDSGLYPADSFEVLVGCDGRTEATAACPRAAAPSNASIYEFLDRLERNDVARIAELAQQLRKLPFVRADVEHQINLELREHRL